MRYSLTGDTGTVRQQTSLGSSGLRRARTDGCRVGQGGGGMAWEMVRGRWHLRPSLMVPAWWQGVDGAGGELGEQPLQQRERGGGERVDINDGRGDSEAGTAWAESGSNSTRLNGEEIGVRVQRLVVWLAGDSDTVPRRRHPATYVDSPSRHDVEEMEEDTNVASRVFFPEGEREGRGGTYPARPVCCCQSRWPPLWSAGEVGSSSSPLAKTGQIISRQTTIMDRLHQPFPRHAG